MLTGIAMVPILGGLALAVDYVDMSRQREDTLNALDAAGIAVARRILEGASDTVVKAYAREFFDANLGSVKPENATLTVVLPANLNGGGRVRLTANLKFDPRFLAPFLSVLNGSDDGVHDQLNFQATSEVQLKNTVEVALVLDNSGSMDENGSGSGKKRIDLLKSASIQLVEQLAATAAIMKQIDKPIQFSLVPFAASVNIGASYATGQTWMDTTGISPMHHENFDWTAFTSTNKKIQQEGSSGPYYKKGSDWGAEQGNTVTRFSLFNELKRNVETCTGSGSSKVCTTSLQPYASWGGCVETRPYPYNTNDDTASTATPATLYVPMFAPDEAGDAWAVSGQTFDNFDAYTNWWNDGTEVPSAKTRQGYTQKYFMPAAKGFAAAAVGGGPNASCTTKAITPLTDVTTTAGMNTIKSAINAMAPLGATNVPDGLAWGWRTLSSKAPFTEGRSETERGNDKVVIVLTDGANTYYTPESLGSTDSAGNKSIYSAFGYTRLINKSNIPGRIFDGTSSSVSKTDFSNDNYTKAMNEQFLKTCENANGGDTGGQGARLIVMTVALDLNATKTQDKAQLQMLEKCASRSRYARDPADPSKGRKLFWNATGANLSQVFKEIADELSNLRIVM